MPRPKRTGPKQISMKLLPGDCERADEVAVMMAGSGCVGSRASVLRMAINRGLRELEDEWLPKRKVKKT